MIRRAVIRFCLWRAEVAGGRATGALFVSVAVRQRSPHAALRLTERAFDDFTSAREWQRLAERVRAL